LRRKLEFHLLGNHLFENIKALIFAGIFFTGAEADEWRLFGTKLLLKQLKEQVLIDGGHFELSPMYHSIILEGVLDLFNLFSTYHIQPPDELKNVIHRMIDWLRCMCHPDGGISFFNDASFGVAPSLETLERYANSLGLLGGKRPAGSRVLNASAYARLERDGAVLLADVAAIGPDYLPGHAHADTLSFELSLHGRRVLVNSGTSVYGIGPERMRQRSTAAHNTVELDGVDSSEVWSGFRVARRAVARIERFETAPQTKLVATHNGYERLAGRPIHRRLWTLETNGLVVSDQVTGHGVHESRVSFYFHPDCCIQATNQSNFTVTMHNGGWTLYFQADPALHWELENSSWHPGFGVSEPNLCIRGSFKGPLPLDIVNRLIW
jgi:uncharacterized heparinase superfamily protein